jgi:hypothetical protein
MANDQACCQPAIAIRVCSRRPGRHIAARSWLTLTPPTKPCHARRLIVAIRRHGSFASDTSWRSAMGRRLVVTHSPHNTASNGAQDGSAGDAGAALAVAGGFAGSRHVLVLHRYDPYRGFGILAHNWIRRHARNSCAQATLRAIRLVRQLQLRSRSRSRSEARRGNAASPFGWNGCRNIGADGTRTATPAPSNKTF